MPTTAHLELMPVRLDDARTLQLGDEPWEAEIAAWLAGDTHAESSLAADLARGNLAWLYLNGEGDIVGVGSIGPATASYPRNSSPRLNATCVTFLAVDRHHRRQGHGQRILDHLLSVALARRETHPLLILFVHPDNADALAWYTNPTNGFTQVGQARTGHLRLVAHLANFEP